MACPIQSDSTIYLGMSKGFCRECRKPVDVRYLSDGQSVFLERYCPLHGKSRVLVAESLPLYLEALQIPTLARPPTKVLTHKTTECPKSCGPCEFHGQQCNLPVFSITNACNLRCPICFTYNRTDAIYTMEPEEFRRHIDFVVEATGGTDLINLTGGEPTLHPQLFHLLEQAKRPEIGRITLNSNGLTLAEDPELARRLADLGIYLILSLDTLRPDRSMILHGRDITSHKLRALENLERFGVPTTLLMVLVADINEDELGPMIALTLKHDFIRSLTIQTMTYTGQGGGHFLPRQHLPVDGVERRIEKITEGQIRQKDFLPLPTAHPLCYGVSYLLLDNQGRAHPLTRWLDRKIIARHLGQGYLLHPSEELERELQLAIDRLWSEGQDPELLQAAKDLLQTLYSREQDPRPFARQQRAEQRIKTIYIHAHMDEDTFEVGRALRCPDQVPVHAEKLVGACSYNLFYRQYDERFWEPGEPCNQQQQLK